MQFEIRYKYFVIQNIEILEIKPNLKEIGTNTF